MLTSQNTLQAIFSAWLRGQVPGNWLNLGVQKRYFSSLLREHYVNKGLGTDQIRPISDRNKKKAKYLKATQDEFGDV
jgi:hypothetical protein